MNHEWEILNDLSPPRTTLSAQIYIGKGSIGGKTLCIIYKDSTWFAIDGKCPHAGGPLFAGKLQEGKIVCPWHRISFDLENGQATSGGYFVNTYPIKEEKGNLWVQIKRKKWKWFWQK